MRQFVSEPLEPLAGTADAGAMARAEPGLPRQFRWRASLHEVAKVHASWKSTKQDMGETYLKRHWHDIETTAGVRLTIYCERQASSRAKRKQRWFVYSVN